MAPFGRRLPSGAVRTTPRDIAQWGVPSAPAAGSVPGTGAGPGQAEVPRVQFPPTYLLPAGAYNFLLSGNGTFGPGPTAFVAFTGAGSSIQLAQGMSGVVKSLTITVNNLLLTSQIQFSLRANGNPVDGFGLIVAPQAGLAVAVINLEPITVKIPAGQLIQLFVLVTDAVAYQMAFELHGWQYNKVLDDQWRGVA